MNRRTLLKNGLSASVLALGGAGAYQFYLQQQNHPASQLSSPAQFLLEDDRVLLEVLIPVMLFESLEHADLSVQQIIQNIDSAIVRLSISTQAELRELFDLLGAMLGRLLVANVWRNWSAASHDSIDGFLNQWKDSHFSLLQTAYKGLHKLIIGSFYAEPASWAQLEYPGPPNLSYFSG